MRTAETIQRFYQTLLDRTGSAAEVAAWTDLVDNSGVSLGQVQTAFINSYEALHAVAPIIEMYQVHCGRVPDQAGLMYWVGQFDSGAMTMAQIGIAIAGSPESQAYDGTAFDGTFITTLYERVLGREPEDGAVAAWLSMKANGMTQAQVQEAFRTSAEAGGRAATPVSNFLAAVAQQNPNVYTGSLYASGLTFTLTTGHDFGAAFVGTTGNDTFQAVEDTTSGSPIPVWTTSDTIDGGAGINTLNVTQTAAITGVPLNATVSNIEIANIIDASTVALNTTGWTGLTTLNVTDVGATALTVAATTDATVTDTAGAVTITGGSSQTVSTSAGAVTLTGATGAIAVTDSALGANAITIDGGTSVALTATGQTGSPLVSIGSTTAPTGAVTVNVSSGPGSPTHTMGAVTVRGGSTVNVTVNELGTPATATITGGAITITGTAVTTSVSVTQTAAATAAAGVTGVVDAAVTVTDVNNASTTLAGTITSVSASNYTTLTVNDNALTTLSVTSGSGNVMINNGNLTTPTNTTLAVTDDGTTGGSLSDSGVYTALNITTANNDAKFANLSMAAVTALTVAGTKKLTLTSTAGLAGLHTVNVSGSAGLVADLSTPGTVTSVDTSATTGASTITINGGQATFNGGAGTDNVTLTASSTKAIALGAGDDTLTIGALVPTAAISGGLGTDTLSIDATAAQTASGSGAFAGLVTGFEKLVLTGATNQVIDLAVLGIANSVQTHGGNGLTMDNLTSGGTLTLDGAGTAYTVDRLTNHSVVDETLNVVLSADASAAGTNFASTGISTPNAQAIAITSVNTSATPAGVNDHMVALQGNVTTSITVSGNNGLNLSASDTAAATVDASGITLGGFTYTSGALTAAAPVIKGSATGTNTVNFSSAIHAVTYTGGTGADNVTSTNNNANVYNLGGGNNTVTASGSGNNTITSGSGTDSITVGNGNNTITTGGGAKTLTVGSGANTITLGAHNSGIADSFTVGATTTGSYVPTAIITGLNTAGADTISFLADTAATFTAYTAGQLITFGNALGNNVTAGSAPPTLAAAVADVLGAAGGNLALHGIGAFQYGGNTYLVEQHGTQGTAFANNDTLIELTGTSTFNTTLVSGGVLHLLT